MEKISIIIPAHNEEKRIGKMIKEYTSFFGQVSKENVLRYEIIVVLNACIDNTLSIVESFKSGHLKILNFKEAGKGFAIKEGFKEALDGDATLIGFVDADLATSPEEYFKLINHVTFREGIIASRYIPGAVVKPKQPLKRRVLSRIGNLIIRSLFFLPYRDTQCGAKIFRRKPIQKVLPKLEMTQWAFDIELLYSLNKEGFRILEFPTIWQDVEGSQLNFKKISIQVLLATLQLRILHSPLKRSWVFFAPLAGALWRLVK